ncbi:helix-turn-helix transcriptional regulator [Bacillus cereus]|uniref:helix-turn-helix transcriptional regulator n=1 Tax=Bacillus cereus TaxID=1396 RepID=UPI0020D22CD1|nr:helix-turn-helix domain-containing protein [Bacillus cereus]
MKLSFTNETYLKSISKVKIAKIKKRLTQLELADVVNVTRQTTSLIESNKFNPFIKICIHIAKTLDKSLDKLFWEEL